LRSSYSIAFPLWVLVVAKFLSFRGGCGVFFFPGDVMLRPVTFVCSPEIGIRRPFSSRGIFYTLPFSPRGGSRISHLDYILGPLSPFFFFFIARIYPGWSLGLSAGYQSQYYFRPINFFFSILKSALAICFAAHF